MESFNILIVEDNQIIYTHITKILKNLGYSNIYTSKNAKEAFQLASETKIDLLFSDIKIDGNIDGIDTAKILQNLYNLPVIFITSNKNKRILSRVAEVNFIGYLIKPFREDEVESLIGISISKFNLIENRTALIEINDYIFNKKTKKLYKNKIEITLSKKEHLFISLLFNNNGFIVPYHVIDETVWYGTCVLDNARRTFFYRFKNKLHDLNFIIEKNIGIGLF